MDRKQTSQLNEELMSEANIDRYLKDNQDQFSCMEAADFLIELFEKRHLSKAELAKRAGISEVYLHQVFSKRRKPSRDRLLCICLGMQVSLEEVQRLLQQAVYAQLYSRIRRDSIIIFGIIHHMSVAEINDKLYFENEETLC